jgi:hypothetical protein
MGIMLLKNKYRYRYIQAAFCISASPPCHASHFEIVKNPQEKSMLINSCAVILKVKW